MSGISKIVLGVFVASTLLWVGVVFVNQSKPDDYHLTLEKLKAQYRATPTQTEELAFRAFKIAQHSGNLSDYNRVEILLSKLPESLETLYLNAKIALHTHDATRAETLINNLFSYADSRAVLLDIQLDIQLGQLETAERKLQEQPNLNQNWQALALLATIYTQKAQPDKAEDLYVQAQELISVKEMDVFAWLELQRGILDLQSGRHQAANQHFALANRAYSGHWLIEEHLAETYVLLGQPQKALTYYESVIRKNESPQYLRALAKLLSDSNTNRANELTRLADARDKAFKSLYPYVSFHHETPPS